MFIPFPESPTRLTDVLNRLAAPQRQLAVRNLQGPIMHPERVLWQIRLRLLTICRVDERITHTMFSRFKYWLVPAAGLFWPTSAWALQSHGGMEGIYAHQLAHLFFSFSMGLLIFWLRKWRLTVSESWRHIQYAALFLIAWNVDTMVSHWLLEQSNLIAVETIAPLKIRITTAEGWQWLTEIYYLTKLDHLLCVPALIFLFLGLRRLLGTALSKEVEREPAP